MAEIGSYEAKTHLPRLLEDVQRGERYVITKHGKPIAELVPYVGPDADDIGKLIASVRRHRAELAKRGVRLSDILERGETLRELAHRGHRY